MEIKNEEHAKEMLKEWQNLPLAARKKKLRVAIEHLELGAMYYEQKGNDKGMLRAIRCATLLNDHLDSLK